MTEPIASAASPVPAGSLQRLLKPRHIAFIGGHNLEDAIRSTEAIGFPGQIWVVNPRHERIAGRRCVRSLADLPAPPDAAFVAVNSELSVQVVAELAAAGAGGAICYAAGFAETGTAGQQLQQALVDAAGTMPVVGPNCYGILNYLDGAALWPDRHGGRRVDRGVALISQSGNVALNLTMADRSCPLAYVISVGNQAALGVHHFIEAMLDDPRVCAIGIYLEGLADVAAFSRAALRALVRGVPIVVLKAGTSELGTQLTLSHTSSLAGADEMVQALFDRLGVIRVPSLTHLIETLKLCAAMGLPPGQRLAILTCSGGDSAMAADLSEQFMLELPALAPEQHAALRALLPPFASISNPLDYNTAIWGKPEELQHCFEIVMSGTQYDATLLVLDFPKPDSGDTAPWQAAAEALVRARQRTGRLAALASTLPELLPEATRERLASGGVAPLQGLGRALRALAETAAYARRRQAMLARPHLEDLALDPALPPGARHRLLDEWESKQALARHGLACPPARRVCAAEAAAAAQALGFPVVAKIASAQVPHKTEAGAVKLHLRNAEDVAGAVAAIGASVASIPGVPDRFLIEKMVDGAVAELIIGLKRDPQFGLALVIGSGGILVELMQDRAVLLLPTSPAEVRRALASLKGYRLLQGFRGRPRGDVDAVVDAVMAVARYAHAHRHEVLEADINPLLVLPEGQGALAADALIRLGEH